MSEILEKYLISSELCKNVILFNFGTAVIAENLKIWVLSNHYFNQTENLLKSQSSLS